LKAEPDFIRIFRHEKAIPQYVVGHADRLQAIEEKLQGHPGLVLTGNAFKGVSLNDCVVNAGKIAESLSLIGLHKNEATSLDRNLFSTDEKWEADQ
ncbi:MAG: hypothetical protein IME97_07860, partial [Proteobacteria bacterium]|nr:hypothetical protein [Pseudomonadota bacterium]